MTLRAQEVLAAVLVLRVVGLAQTFLSTVVAATAAVYGHILAAFCGVPCVFLLLYIILFYIHISKKVEVEYE